MSRLSTISSRISLAAAAIWLIALAGPARAALNSQEQALADRIINDANQGRASVTVDPILSAVARAKAADMANREFFAHTNPDGHGANYLVRRAGYSLPSSYSAAPDGNNIESLAAGYSSVSSVWSGWMTSPDHKRHILGETSFFAAQTSLGVGFYEDSGAPYRYYWVILTAPPSGPRLTIASPVANASVTSASATVAGTAGGAPVPARIEVRVENANGNGGYITASGTTSWSASVNGLASGANTLRVRSVAADGSVITETTRAVRRIVLEELTVSVDGNGIVSSAFAGATQREVGRAYSVSAAPRDGWIFSHWSGGESSQSARLTFQMRAGLALTAHFIPNPFLTRKGSHNGLLSSGSAEHATSGFVKVTVGSTGAVSGRLLLGGASYAFTGQLNANGDATITIPRTGRAPLTVTLNLDTNATTDRIAGTLTDGTISATFDADRAWQAGSAPSAFAGRYTLALPASGSFATPEGAGWAVLVVSTKGVGTLAGKLADGAAIAASATVSEDGEMPIFRALYSSLGSISGSLQFRVTSESDLDGSFYWHKPERPTATRYRAAFSAENLLVGCRYAAPASGQRVISMSADAGNAVVSLAGGDLASGLTQSVTVTSANGVKAIAPVAKGFTAAIKSANGCFSGTFTDPADNVARRFEGIFLQKQNAGFGFFLGAELSGMVEFEPSGP